MSYTMRVGDKVQLSGHNHPHDRLHESRRDKILQVPYGVVESAERDGLEGRVLWGEVFQYWHYAIELKLANLDFRTQDEGGVV